MAKAYVLTCRRMEVKYIGERAQVRAESDRIATRVLNAGELASSDAQVEDRVQWYGPVAAMKLATQGVATTGALNTACLEHLLREVAADAVARTAKPDTLIFIHGFDFTWRESLRFLELLVGWYADHPDSRVGRVILYSWPSASGVFDYKRCVEAAGLSGQTLAHVVRHLVGRASSAGMIDADRTLQWPGKIHLMAHSHGTRVLSIAAGALLADGDVPVALLDHAFLLNADVPSDVLFGPTGRARVGNALSELHRWVKVPVPGAPSKIQLYTHRGDDVLGMLSRGVAAMGRRLGTQGPRWRRWPQGQPEPALPPIPDTHFVALENADHRTVPTDPVTSEMALRMRHTPSILTRVGDHWGYVNYPKIAADILYTMLGQQSPLRQEDPGRAPAGQWSKLV